MVAVQNATGKTVCLGISLQWHQTSRKFYCKYQHRPCKTITGWNRRVLKHNQQWQPSHKKPAAQ